MGLGNKTGFGLIDPNLPITLQTLEGQKRLMDNKIGCVQHDCEKCRARIKLMANDNRGITKAEFEVLEWVVKGKSNPQIAAIMGKDKYTVKNQVASLIRKLDTCNRTGAVVQALRFGLIDLVTLTQVKEI